MSNEEIVRRLTTFQFLLQTGYTFENALRVIKRALNPIPERIQANSEHLMKLMASEVAPERSAIEVIKAGEAAYLEAKEDEEEERRKQAILCGPPPRSQEEEERKVAEPAHRAVELPRYTE